MSSRQEEKEARRLARQQEEANEAKAAARRLRLQLVFGGVLGLALLAALVALAAGLFKGDSGSAGDKPRTTPKSTAKLPEPVETELDAAVKAAGCTLTNAKYEGAGHDKKKFVASDYKTNPPSSGTHAFTWYDDGIYEPGSVPELGKLVHTLEHGRIDFQYKAGIPANRIAQLETLYAETDGYHTLLFENTTNMPFEVAATAWTHVLGCKKFTDQSFDALRAFRERYVDKGPEQVP